MCSDSIFRKFDSIYNFFFAHENISENHFGKSFLPEFKYEQTSWKWVLKLVLLTEVDFSKWACILKRLPCTLLLVLALSSNFQKSIFSNWKKNLHRRLAFRFSQISPIIYQSCTALHMHMYNVYDVSKVMETGIIGSFYLCFLTASSSWVGAVLGHPFVIIPKFLNLKDGA